MLPRDVLEERLRIWARRNTRLIYTVIISGELLCVVLFAMAVLFATWWMFVLVPLGVLLAVIFFTARNHQERLSSNIVDIRRGLDKRVNQR